MNDPAFNPFALEDVSRSIFDSIANQQQQEERNETENRDHSAHGPPESIATSSEVSAPESIATSSEVSIPQLPVSSLGNDINFFQQLQHLGATAASNSSAPAAAPDPPPPLLYPNHLSSFLDQKLLEQAQLENQMSQRLITTPADPLLQGPLLYDLQMTAFASALNKEMASSAPPLAPPPRTQDTDQWNRRRMRGGVVEPFPEKLHRLLMEVEESGESDVISFIANGRAFAIHKQDMFFKEIVPRYFKQTRLSSFKRQLNLYSFEMIHAGPARGGYYHVLFRRDEPEMCKRMRRVAVKVQAKNKEEKPFDFYELEHVQDFYDERQQQDEMQETHAMAPRAA